MDPQTLIEGIVNGGDMPSKGKIKAYNDWIAKGGYKARIQLHPATDEWMRGDRYADVVGLTPSGYLKLQLDRSGRIKTLHPDLATIIP